MKFTKEDACKELTTQLSVKVENINDWQRTINENVETLFSIIGENEDLELSDFVEKALPLFNTTSGFLRKKNADLAKSFESKIKDLEEKAKGNPKSIEPSDIEKRLMLIEQRYEQQLVKEKQDLVKQNLLSKLKEKGVKDDVWANAILEEINLSESCDLDEKAQTLLKIYNINKAKVQPNITPLSASGGISESYEKEFSDVKALREKKLKEQGITN